MQPRKGWSGRTDRWIAVCVLGGMVLVGCVWNEPEDTGVDPAATTVPATSAVPRCSEVTVEDEYGYPIEVEQCDDSPIEQRRDPAELLALVPSASARDGLAGALRSAEALNAVCGDLAAWSADGQTTADGVFEVADRVASDPELADWVGSDDAAELGALLRNRIVIQSGCDPGAASAPGADVVEDALATAGKLTGANDAIWFALTDPDRPQVASEFWFGPDQIAHIAEARRLLAIGEIDVLMAGPSSGVRAYDPLALSEASGDVWFNASVAALLPPGMPGWLDTLFGIGVDPDRVVLTLDAWSDGLPCNRGVERRATSALEFAARAFENVPGVGDQPPLMRLVGGDAISIEGELARLAFARWVPESRGVSAGGLARSQDQADRQLDAYTPRFTDEVVCNDSLSTFEDMIAMLQGRGIDVVVVALPVSDLMSGLFPGGRDGLNARIGEYRTTFETLGIELVDLSDRVEDELFVDLTHLTADGRSTVTEALIAALVTPSEDGS